MTLQWKVYIKKKKKNKTLRYQYIYISVYSTYLGTTFRAVATHLEVGGEIETPPSFSPFPFPSCRRKFKIKVFTWPENTLPGSQNL